MKDPAFLLYYKDFLVSTDHMDNETIGAYFRCLCHQADKGFISDFHMKKICFSHENHMRNITQSQPEQNDFTAKSHAEQNDFNFVSNRVYNEVKKKFSSIPGSDNYVNLRLKSEIEKRKAYAQSRSNNRIGKKKKGKNISFSYENHMVNVNEDVIVNENVNYKKGVIGGKNEKVDFEKIIDDFNNRCHLSPKVQKLSDTRKRKIRSRYSEHGLAGIYQVFRQVAESDFLTGKNDRGWVADFDWIFSPENFLKILEGKYVNRNGHSAKPSRLSKLMSINESLNNDNSNSNN